MNITLLASDPVMNLSMIISFILFSFITFLLLLYLFSSRRKQPQGRTVSLPKVSILIPAYNEEEKITRCLEAIRKADYSKRLYELLVVNDKSTDKTAKSVKSFAKRYPSFPLKLLTIKHAGKVGALKRGVAATRHPLILTIDADIEIGPAAIKELVTPFEKRAVGATTAVAFIKDPKGFVGWCQMIEYGMNNLIRTSFERLFESSVWFFGAVACYRRSALLKAGNFRKDTLTEDMDISLALFNAGFLVETCERAKIFTTAMATPFALIQQRMRWYMGALQSLTKHRALLRKNHSPAVIFLYVNQFWWTLFSFLFFPLTAYQVWYWWPGIVSENIWYLFRWFSLSGPFFVLYKLPEWGLNSLNIFGVTAGILTLILSIGALRRFRIKIQLPMLLALFFYFPYTMLLNISIILGVVSHPFRKVRYFKG